MAGAAFRHCQPGMGVVFYFYFYFFLILLFILEQYIRQCRFSVQSAQVILVTHPGKYTGSDDLSRTSEATVCTVNVDILACIDFRGSTKTDSFTDIQICTLSITGCLCFYQGNFHLFAEI